jgi:hypothetical protein
MTNWGNRRGRLRSRWCHNWCRSRRLRSSRGRGCRCFVRNRLRHGRNRSRRRTRFHYHRCHTRLWWRSRCSRPHPRGFRRRFLRFFVRFGSRFRLCFFFGGALNLFAHFFRDVRGDRARVRLLFRDAIPRQQVNDGFRLDLEFAGQFVNSDLIYVGHALRSELRLRLFRLRLLAFTAGGRGFFRCLRGSRRFFNCICRL